MVEAPGTAPGSEWFIPTAIYRHSRQAGTANIGGNGRGRKSAGPVLFKKCGFRPDRRPGRQGLDAPSRPPSHGTFYRGRRAPGRVRLERPEAPAPRAKAGCHRRPNRFAAVGGWRSAKARSTPPGGARAPGHAACRRNPRKTLPGRRDRHFRSNPAGLPVSRCPEMTAFGAGRPCARQGAEHKLENM